MERTYYTLDDIRIKLGMSPDTKGPYTLKTLSFSNFLDDCLVKVNFSLSPGTTETAESETCFRNYIWPRFYQEVVVYVDSDEDEDFVKKFASTKVGQIMS